MSELRDLSFEGLVIAHHLGELDQEELAVLAAELTRRGSDGREVARRLGRTLGEVALAAAPAEPPLALRARVLAAASTSQPAPPPLPAPARSRRAWQAAGILGVLLAAGLGLWAAQLAEEGKRLRGVVERLEARAAGADAARAEIGPLLSDLELAGEPGSLVYPLTGSPAVPQAGARLFVDTIAGRAVLLASGLPRLKTDQAFELWSFGGEGARAVAMFRPDADGRARRGIADLELLRDAQALAVTIEPASGAAQPSGEIVLSSSF